MLYLSGTKNPAIAEDLANGTMGLLATPATGYALGNVHVWALDNGAYTGRYPGDEAYLHLLARLEPHREHCLFVAAPDIVADAAGTLARFTEMGPRITAAGWPVALVAQDGLTPEDVPWHQLGWLFIGGSTQWKLSAAVVALIRRAQQEGVKIHVGRVNSARRYMRFASLGCDSADGTFIAYGPDRNAPQVRQWIRGGIQTAML